MKKYKVLKDFYDKHTGELIAEGKTIELTDERAAEIREGLAAYGEFIKETGGKKNAKDKEADKADEVNTDEVNADEAVDKTEDNKEVKEAE